MNLGRSADGAEMFRRFAAKFVRRRLFLMPADPCPVPAPKSEKMRAGSYAIGWP